MTIVRLLFALNQKGVKLSAGKRGRIRFNPRAPVSPAMKTAIQEHKPAILALLRGEDFDAWRMVRLRPPRGEEWVDADDDPGQSYDHFPQPEWSADELEEIRLAEIEDQRQALPWESGSGE